MLAESALSENACRECAFGKCLQRVRFRKMLAEIALSDYATTKRTTVNAQGKVTQLHELALVNQNCSGGVRFAWRSCKKDALE